MRINVVKVMMVVIVVVAFGITGCGGGGGASEPAAAPVVAQKVSVVDGKWNIITSTAPYLEKANYEYMTVNFSDGKINTNAQAWPVIATKDGTFTLTGDVLTYNLTLKEAITASLSTDPPGMDLKYNINETGTVYVIVSSNSMTWKNSAGFVVATFSK